MTDTPQFDLRASARAEALARCEAADMVLDPDPIETLLDNLMDGVTAALNRAGLDEQVLQWAATHQAGLRRLADNDAVIIARDDLEETVSVLEDYESTVTRIDDEPLEGRDARILGVEDGWCSAPTSYEWDRLHERGREAVRSTKAILERS